MPIISQDPIDIEWTVQLGSAAYEIGFNAALVAAVALSAANSNALVNVYVVDQTVTAPTSITLASVQMPSGSATPMYFVQLDSILAVYPLEVARVAGYALSAANASAPVNLCRQFINVTAP